MFKLFIKTALSSPSKPKFLTTPFKLPSITLPGNKIKGSLDINHHPRFESRYESRKTRFYSFLIASSISLYMLWLIDHQRNSYNASASQDKVRVLGKQIKALENSSCFKDLVLSHTHGAAILKSGDVIQWRINDDKPRITYRGNAAKLAISQDKVFVLSEKGRVFVLNDDADAVEQLTLLQRVMGHDSNALQIKSPSVVQNISAQGNLVYASSGSSLYSYSANEPSSLTSDVCFQKVSDLPSKIVSLSSGNSHTLVQTVDSVFGIGSNQFGQLAHPITTSTAQLDLTLLPVKSNAVKAGSDTSIFLDGNKVYGCGNGINGQIGSQFVHAQSQIKPVETGFTQYWKDGALHEFKILDFDCGNHAVYLVDVGGGQCVDLLLAGRHDGGKAKVGGCVWDEQEGRRVQFYCGKGVEPRVCVGLEQTVIWFKV